MIWEKVKISDVSSQIRGVSYKPSDVSEIKNEGYSSILRANNIHKYGLDFNDLVYVKNGRVSEKQFLKKGDIVIAASSGSKEIVGKAASVKDDWEGSFGAFCKTIRPNSRINSAYLGFYFQSPSYRSIISHLSSGANINNLRTSDLDDLEIPLPPLPIQQKIAEKLDKADALRKKDKELLAQYDELAQAIFIDMFGDPVRNEKGWELSLFGEKFRISSGGTPRTNVPEYWQNGNISWIGSNMCQDKVLYENDGKYITEIGLRNSAAKIFEIDTILVALVGATIGKTALLKFPTSTNQNIAGIEIDKSNFDAMFAFYLLQNLYNKFMELGNGGFKMANLTFIRGLPLILPPLQLQQKFATIIQNIEQQKQKVKLQAEESENLFQALLQESFA